MKIAFNPMLAVNRSPKSKQALESLGFTYIFRDEAEPLPGLYNSFILDIPSKHYWIGRASKTYPHISIDVLPALTLMQPNAIIEFCKGINK